MSLALYDSLICFEMPIFAIAHVTVFYSLASVPSDAAIQQYAFQASDYINHSLKHAVSRDSISLVKNSLRLR